MLPLKFSTTLRGFLYRNDAKSKVCDYLTMCEYQSDKFANYLAIRGDKITFCPAGKEQTFNEDGSWKRENRQEGKPAKIARKLLTDEAMALLTDKDFETFANLLKGSDISQTGTFKIVKGEQIRFYYHVDQYADSCGSLNESCMRYDYKQDYFDIYCKNDCVSMLILLNKEDKLIGRAILWQIGDTKIMDRIYGSDATTEAFKEYAQDHDFIYKKEQSFDSQTQFVNPNGESITRNFTVKLNTDFDSFPYMDTFKYLYHGELRNRSDGNELKELTDQDGNTETVDEHENERWDDVDDCYIDEDDAVTTDRELTTHIDNCGHCYSCGHRHWYLTSDLTEDEITGDHYCGNHIMRLGDGRDVGTDSDTFKCELDGEDYLWSDRVELIDRFGGHHEIYKDNVDDFKQDHEGWFTEDSEDHEPYIFNPNQCVIDFEEHKKSLDENLIH